LSKIGAFILGVQNTFHSSITRTSTERFFAVTIASKMLVSVQIYTSIHILFFAECIFSISFCFSSFEGKTIIPPDFERVEYHSQEITEKFPL